MDELKLEIINFIEKKKNIKITWTEVRYEPGKYQTQRQTTLGFKATFSVIWGSEPILCQP